MKTTTNSLEAYKDSQANIKKLLGQINTGLEKHNREASKSFPSHNWAHVGDLQHVEELLKEVKTFLYNEE